MGVETPRAGFILRNREREVAGAALKIHDGTSPELRRVVVVRVGLAEVAEEFVEPAPSGRRATAFETEPPFTNDPGAVAGALEDFRDRGFVGAEWNFRVPADAGVARVQAGHQCGAGGCADAGACVALRETQALGGKLIQVGRFDFLLPIAAEVAVAQIVGEDEDDVGARAKGGELRRNGVGERSGVRARNALPDQRPRGRGLRKRREPARQQQDNPHARDTESG